MKARTTDSSSLTSSKKAQNGSSKGGQSHNSPPQQFYNAHLQTSEKSVYYFLNYERDFKSYAVREYDAHQEVARRSHEAALWEDVKKTF
jgi:hypothetical protein